MNRELEKIQTLVQENLVSFADWNQTFYSNWRKIKTISAEQWFFDQMVHYITATLSDINLIDRDEIYFPDKGEIHSGDCRL